MSTLSRPAAADVKPTLVAAFHAFYADVYLPDHAAPLNRWVHFASNLGAVACCVGGVVVADASLFALGVWCQLGPPYLGHLLFEKTHRSIDQSPVFAALGSWFTTIEILRGKQCLTHGRACAADDDAEAV